MYFGLFVTTTLLALSDISRTIPSKFDKPENTFLCFWHLDVIIFLIITGQLSFNSVLWYIGNVSKRTLEKPFKVDGDGISVDFG